jgi:hypothetical protein
MITGGKLTKKLTQEVVVGEVEGVHFVALLVALIRLLPAQILPRKLILNKLLHPIINHKDHPILLQYRGVIIQ